MARPIQEDPRGERPRYPRRGESPFPPRPVPPVEPPTRPAPDGGEGRGEYAPSNPRVPNDASRPGLSGPGDPNLPPVPPNPNPPDMPPRTDGRITYHNAGGEPPVYDDQQYIDMGMEPYTEDPSAQPPAPPQPYVPRYTPTQGTGGPEFRSSGTGQQLSENDRLMSEHQGNVLEQDYVTDLNYNVNQADQYGQKTDAAYDPLLAGQGGYTPQEAEGIQTAGSLDPLVLTQEQIDGQQLQQHEQDAIKGDPYKAMAYFNPEVQRSVQMEGEKRRVENAAKMENDLNSAIDPSKLSVREGYGSDLTGAVDTTEGQIADYLNPETLTVSDEFLNDYGMSDQEKQGMVTSAGMDVRDRYQSQIDDMGRRQRAEGVNAVGAAAMQERLQRQAASGAGDMMTRARVQADAEAAQRQIEGKNLQLRYGQNLAGMQTDAALNVGDQRRSAMTEAERLRLASEQDISGRKTNAATVSGQANIDVADRNAVTALANEKDLSKTGHDYQQSADDRTSDRATTVATNRQGVSQQGQVSQFGQGTAVAGMKSGQNQTVADARMGQQQQARDYFAGKQAQANQNVQSAHNRRGDLYATQAGAQSRNTGNKIAAEGTPGKGERIVAGVVGAAGSVAGGWLGGKAQGGVVTKPTYALVGEAGPEAIVPLTGEDPEVLPGIAMQYGQEPFATAPMPSRKAPAYGRQLRYAG
jgi:hypothetical protein